MAAYLGMGLTVGPHPVSILWPANTVLLAALVLAPVRSWGMLLLAALPAHLVVEWRHGIPLKMVLSWFFSNSCEALIGATAVRFLIPGRLALDRLRHMCVFFFCGVLLAPFVSSFIDAALVILNHWGPDGYWEVWRMRFCSNAVASATVGLAIVTWITGGPIRGLPLVRRVEGVALVSGLVTVMSLAVFHPLKANVGVDWFLWLPWPFLLWAALRFSIRGTSAALLIVCSVTIWSMIRANHPLLTADELNVQYVQTFFVVLSFTLMPLASLLQERQNVEQALRESEERYRGIVETQPDLICRFFADTTLTFVNQSYCRFFQRTAKDLLGRKFLDFVTRPAQEQIMLSIASVITERRTVVCEHEVYLPQGGVGWHQWINHPIVDADGKIRELQAIGRDFTERRRTEAALLESTERNQAMLKAIPDSIFLVHKSGVLLDCETTDESLLLIPRHQCVGEDVGKVLPRKLLTELRRHSQSVLQPGITATRQRTVIVHEEDRCYEMRLVKCGAERILMLLRDVTEQQEAQQLAEEAKQKLIHASRLAAIGEFTAMMAHEVNQPLNAILTNTEAANSMLNEEAVPFNEVRAILADIRQDILRARQAINRIRALAQRRKMELQPLDLNKLLEDVVHLAAGDALRCHVQMRTDLAANLPLVHGDPGHIQHIVMNLVLNGIEAMRQVHGVERLLTIKTEQQEREVLVSVRDTDQGIPPESMPRVFEAFFSTKTTGMGLGLSIARTIVDAHGGRLWVENNPDRGVTFFFTLPLHA